MSGAITATVLGGAMLGSVALGASMSQKPPKPPKPQAPTPLPQSAQMPDQAAARRATAGGTGPGRAGGAGTMLTGAGGIDPGALLLGKNTLLGQ